MSATLIHNGMLIDGRGGKPVANGAVLIRNNQIAAVSPKSELPPLHEDVQQIDVNGGVIMPGMIDTHVHFIFEEINLMRMMNTPYSMGYFQIIDRMKRTLDAGITSVRDAGGADLGIKQAVETGLIAGPRMQISITVLSITGGHGDGWLPSGAGMNLFVATPGRPAGICDGVVEVRKKVREILRAGAEVIKVCSTGGVLSPTDHPEFTQYSEEELRVMVEEAQFRRGIKVMAHAQGAEGIKNAVRAGIHSIEHGIFLDEEAIELMLARGTFLVPTLLAPLAVLEIAETTGTVPEWGVRKARETVEIHSENIGKAYQAGVRIAMGTDAGVMKHGTNLRELGLMCNVGMSPMESIVATTKVAAECLGWEDRVGTLQVGKLADIIVCKKNPLADIRVLEENANIGLVVKDGRVYKNTL